MLSLRVSVYLWLVVQNRVQQGTVDLDLPVVADEAKFAELVHEKNSRAIASCRSFQRGFPG